MYKLYMYMHCCTVILCTMGTDNFLIFLKFLIIAHYMYTELALLKIVIVNNNYKMTAHHTVN